MLRYFKRSSRKSATSSLDQQDVDEAQQTTDAPEGVEASKAHEQGPMSVGQSLHMSERRLVSRSVPVPDVVEGNDEADWAMWEHAKSFQDSQLPADLEGNRDFDWALMADTVTCHETEPPDIEIGTDPAELALSLDYLAMRDSLLEQLSTGSTVVSRTPEPISSDDIEMIELPLSFPDDPAE